MVFNTKLDWKPLPGLGGFSAIGGFNFSLLEQRSYYASQRLNDQITLNQSSLNQSSNKDIYKTMQFTGEYNKDVGNHFFSALLGYSFEQQDYSYFDAYRQDFPSNQYTVLELGGLENQQNGGYDAAWAIQSVFSRLKYSFMEKYLFEGDGQERRLFSLSGGSEICPLPLRRRGLAHRAGAVHEVHFLAFRPETESFLRGFWAIRTLETTPTNKYWRRAATTPSATR